MIFVKGGIKSGKELLRSAQGPYGVTKLMVYIQGAKFPVTRTTLYIEENFVSFSLYSANFVSQVNMFWNKSGSSASVLMSI